MGGEHAQRSPRRLDHHFQRQSLHGRHGRIGRPGQQVAQDLPQRQAAHDQVAELAASFVPVRQVGGDAEGHSIARQESAQGGDLILATAAGQAVEADGNLLQAEQIEIRRFAGAADDSREIHAAVAAPPPLDVPGDDAHASSVEHGGTSGCPGTTNGQEP